MKKPVKIIAFSCVLSSAVTSGVCGADDCEPVDTEATIAALVAENEGSKVLKVEETVDENGCVVLQVRILIDGTVKAITIPEGNGA